MTVEGGWRTPALLGTLGLGTIGCRFVISHGGDNDDAGKRSHCAKEVVLSQIFIELYKYRPAWIDLDPSGRDKFSDGIKKALVDLVANGVEVIGWGFNDLESDRRAPYDFYGVYKVPSFDFQRAFDAAVVGSGWHDLFEQVSVSGALVEPAEILAVNIALGRPVPRA